MSQPEAEGASPGTHAFGHDDVPARGGVYFLITRGIIYDVIVEPPSIGSINDEHTQQRPMTELVDNTYWKG